MPSREEAKQQRRDAIIAAAVRLMRARGDAGFSMRALADAAGVSIATPYNLFGSKQAIMLAVLDAGMAQFEAEIAALDGDALDVFFQAVSVAVAFYGEAPRFHQAVLFAAYGEGGREHRAVFDDPRFLFWQSRVEAAQAAGFLEAGLDARCFALTLAQQFFVCILEWAYGQTALEEVELRVQYAFTLLLRGAATRRAAPRLAARLPALQLRLQAQWRTPAGDLRADRSA